MRGHSGRGQGCRLGHAGENQAELLERSILGIRRSGKRGCTRSAGETERISKSTGRPGGFVGGRNRGDGAEVREESQSSGNSLSPGARDVYPSAAIMFP